ncbi:UNVERIFIED_CONTAM: hypothetical protein Q9R58_28020 [Methylobacteriaceae bacterium AG10]|nr:hypothetical protein [Methylobacteriaceae bacterium AG10]
MADTATVAVEATEERFRALKHFPSGLGFAEDGTARWPADQFTFRLRDDGAIRLTEDLHDTGAPAEAEPAPAGKPTAAAKAAPSPKE